MSLGNRLRQLAVRGYLTAGVVLLTAGVGPCDAQTLDQQNDSKTGQPNSTREEGQPESRADPSYPLAIQNLLNRIVHALEAANANPEP